MIKLRESIFKSETVYVTINYKMMNKSMFLVKLKRESGRCKDLFSKNWPLGSELNWFRIPALKDN